MTNNSFDTTSVDTQQLLTDCMCRQADTVQCPEQTKPKNAK